MCRDCSPASAASIDLRGRSCWCRKASDQFASQRMRRPRLLQRTRPITIAVVARRSGERAARVCEIQVTIGGLLPPSWHGGSSAHILVLPNQPKPVSQPDCSIQNSCMHDRSERFLLPGRSHQVAACMPCCLALPCTPAIQVVRSVQLSQIRRSVKSIDQSNPSTLATYSRSAFHATTRHCTAGGGVALDDQGAAGAAAAPKRKSKSSKCNFMPATLRTQPGARRARAPLHRIHHLRGGSQRRRSAAVRCPRCSLHIF